MVYGSNPLDYNVHNTVRHISREYFEKLLCALLLLRDI